MRHQWPWLDQAGTMEGGPPFNSGLTAPQLHPPPQGDLPTNDLVQGKAGQEDPECLREAAPRGGPAPSLMHLKATPEGEAPNVQAEPGTTDPPGTTMLNQDSLSDEPAPAQEAGGGSRAHGGSADPACVDSSRVAHIIRPRCMMMYVPKLILNYACCRPVAERTSKVGTRTGDPP